MDSRRKGKPYVWVTWIVGLLAGTSKCEWAAWFKAHFRYAKREQDGDLAEWKEQHDAMVRARVKRMLADGYEVTVEDENAIKIDGETAILAAKPDIVGMKDRKLLVVDEKSGAERESDRWQVIVYMLGLRRQYARLNLAEVAGEVEYRARSISIPASEINPKNQARIGEIMRVVAGELEPPRTPSASECQFCDIDSCPERIEPVVIDGKGIGF